MIKSRIDTTMQYVKAIKPHFHEDILEIILVLKGRINIQKVERQLDVNEGEMTFVNRHIVHSIKSEGAYILSTKIDLKAFKDIFDKMEYVEFVNNNEVISTIERPLKTGLNEMLRELLINSYCFKHGIIGFEDEAEKVFNETTLMNILVQYYQLCIHLKENEEYPSEELLGRYYGVVAYVVENIQQKITVEDVMQHFFMNTTYFSQFMKIN